MVKKRFQENLYDYIPFKKIILSKDLSVRRAP